MRLLISTIALAGLLTAGAAPETFTGVITDTMCGARHGMLKGQPDDECIKACVKGSSVYALFDGKNVLKLSDQKNSAKFSAKRVKVTGVYNKPHEVDQSRLDRARWRSSLRQIDSIALPVT